MKQYYCPVCNKRTCDSPKNLKISKRSKSNENKADMLIKCQGCKNELAIKVTKEVFATEQTSPHREVIS